MNTLPLTQSEYEVEINRRNKLFANASIREKRVLIARDVLSQITNQHFVPRRGRFISPSKNKYGGFSARRGENLREAVLKSDLVCDCCALGSLMLSCTLFNNNIPIEDQFTYDLGYTLDRKEEIPNSFNKYFSLTQLVLIENAFELGNGFWCIDSGNLSTGDKIRKKNKKEVIKAIAFGNKFPDVKDRLVAIMYNIIANDGMFKP